MRKKYHPCIAYTPPVFTIFAPYEKIIPCTAYKPVVFTVYLVCHKSGKHKIHKSIFINIFMIQKECSLYCADGGCVLITRKAVGCLCIIFTFSVDQYPWAVIGHGRRLSIPCVLTSLQCNMNTMNRLYGLGKEKGWLTAFSFWFEQSVSNNVLFMTSMSLLKAQGSLTLLWNGEMLQIQFYGEFKSYISVLTKDATVQPFSFITDTLNNPGDNF